LNGAYEMRKWGIDRPQRNVVGGDANHVRPLLPVGVPANRNLRERAKWHYKKSEMCFKNLNSDSPLI
jgi:hypothetical protein